MRRKAIGVCALLFLGMLGLGSDEALAYKGFVGVWQQAKGGYYWHTGMTLNELKANDAKYFKQGYRIHAVDSYKHSDIPLQISYSAVWRPGSGKQWWWGGLDVDEFKAKDNHYFKQGFRLAALDVQNGSVIAVWRPGVGEQRWLIGVSINRITEADKEYFKRGLRLVMLKQHGSNDFAAVWRPGSGAQWWKAGMGTGGFNEKNREHFQQGLRLVSLDSYDGKWNAVWRPGSGAQRVAWGMPFDGLKKKVDDYADDGMRLVVLRAKSYHSAEKDGSSSNGSSGCNVWATAYNDVCYNVDGSQSTVLTPRTIEADGCGPDQEAARQAAKVRLALVLGSCLTTPQERRAGCCTYKFQ